MKAAVGTLLLAAIFAVPATADIRVWSERDRQGEGREIRRAVRDLRNYDFDDRISSLETDEAWEICTEPLYRGDCRIVQGVVPNLRVLGLNNRITSMRKASEEMIADLPVAPTAPSKTERTKAQAATSSSTVKAEPVPERSARAETAPTPTTKAEPVPTAPERTKAQATTSTPTAKAEPVPQRSASAETAPTPVTKAEPVPTAPPKTERAAASTIKTESIPDPPAKPERTSTPPSKTEPVPTAPPKTERASASTTKTESIPEPAAEPAPEPSASAVAEPSEVDTPADAWRAVKPPPPAPKPEPTPVTGEWWQGGDETAGAPPTLDLFEKPNFEGRRVRLDQAISDVTQLDQSVGSLLVRTGSWQICSKPKFRGRCRTVDATGMGVPETPLIGSLRPETD